MNAPKEPVDVLFVCSANVCRSVIGAHAFERALAEADEFEGLRVANRGVDVRGVLEACHRAGDVLPDPEIHARLAAHRSRPLKPGMIARSTLILAASREVRAAIVTMQPAARPKVFTVKEAVWLAEGFSTSSVQEPGPVLQGFTAYLNAQRGLRPMPEASRRRKKETAHALDIVDGHILGGRAHRETVTTTALLSSELAGILTGTQSKKKRSTLARFVK